MQYILFSAYVCNLCTWYTSPLLLMVIFIDPSNKFHESKIFLYFYKSITFVLKSEHIGYEHFTFSSKRQNHKEMSILIQKFSKTKLFY